jgi:hypothetical protein
MSDVRLKTVHLTKIRVAEDGSFYKYLADWRKIMQAQEQVQPLSIEEDFLVPLSEDQQANIQGGALPLLAVGAAARFAAPYVVRGVAAAAKNKNVRRGAGIAVGGLMAGFTGAAGADAYNRLVS